MRAPLFFPVPHFLTLNTPVLENQKQHNHTSEIDHDWNISDRPEKISDLRIRHLAASNPSIHSSSMPSKSQWEKSDEQEFTLEHTHTLDPRGQSLLSATLEDIDKP